jgi:DNA polymerase-3 subunit gamma/tau
VPAPDPAAPGPQPAAPPPQPAAPPPQPAAPAPQPAAAATAGPVDTEQLIRRWPDILEAVRNERKVAWILLASATVQSLADNALTIGFPGEGNAKGFVSSGHDAVLSQVLKQMFGITPQIRPIARTPETASGPAGRGGGGSAAGPAAGRGTSARPAAPPAARPPSASGPPAATSPASRNDAPPWDGPADEWDDPGDDEDEYADAASVPPMPPPAAPPAPGPRPGAAGPGAGVLTGMDLIERELGGRVIEDPGLA